MLQYGTNTSRLVIMAQCSFSHGYVNVTPFESLVWIVQDKGKAPMALDEQTCMIALKVLLCRNNGKNVE